MVKALPVEILQSIFDFVATANQIQASLPPLDHANYLEGLQEQQTLVAAARVCRQWTKAADRSLYRHILVCDPDKASGVLRKVQWHSELADGVRTLRFFCLKPLHRSGQVNIKLLFRRLPKLRNYSIDTTRFPDTYCAEVVPTHKHVRNLERLDVLARHYLPGDDALHSRLPVSPLPRRLKRLQLRGLDLANIDVFKLPHLDYLALDCLAQESMKAGVFGGSTRLKHLVLNDPDRPGAGMVIRQLGHQLETLELNYDDQMNQDVLPIERDTMKPLSNLVSFALRGDFFESEIPHIPQTIRYFCWRGEPTPKQSTRSLRPCVTQCICPTWWNSPSFTCRRKPDIVILLSAK